MKRIITFTKSEYLELTRAMRSAGAGDMNLGAITEGAVCCALDIVRECSDENKDTCHSDRLCVRGDIFLLVQEHGTTSFRTASTFHVRCYASYEETLREILGCFEAAVGANRELYDGIRNTGLTWTTSVINSPANVTLHSVSLKDPDETTLLIDWDSFTLPQTADTDKEQGDTPHVRCP